MGQLNALDKALSARALVERATLRQSDDQARRPGHPLGRQLRHQGRRIHRHAGRQRRRQDDAHARRARPHSRRFGRGQRSWQAADARQRSYRLHAAKPRRHRRPEAHQLGHRRQRRDRRAASGLSGSTRRRGARSTGRSNKSTRVILPADRSANCRAASASGCC